MTPGNNCEVILQTVAYAAIDIRRRWQEDSEDNLLNRTSLRNDNSLNQSKSIRIQVLKISYFIECTGIMKYNTINHAHKEHIVQQHKNINSYQLAK